ncbi:MAG: serine/threonine-protein kinase [Myxococcota bacterium]
MAVAEPEPPSIEHSIEGDLASGEIMGGRYRLGSLLGRGGMGEVYRAFDVAMARPVALKRFRLAADREADKLRFRREFHTLAQFSHPRIVDAYDFGLDESGQPFYTMELLDGRDLGKLAPMEWKRACPLLRDVASALAFLHSRQLLHRDIAPRNVRCTSDGRAKLIDFGMMATVGVSNEIVGTLPSIAPEMILGLPMDGRADLFGLGALAFWLLTGRHPQRVRSLDDLMRNGRRPPPPPSRLVADIPPELDDLVLSLLSPEPLGRPNGASALIDRLTAIADLAQAPELDVAQGYVHSARLVGRSREIELLRKRIERTVAGSGSSVIIEGRSGMGKTRLMREIELEAKLAGALVLRGEGEITGPYALIRTLARELELGVRGGVIGNSGPHGALIDRLLPVLGAPRGRGMPTLSSTDTQRVDHREERLALQTALSDFMSTFAVHRPLVILIDNVHRVDEGSAAVLASLAHLAHDRSLLVIGSIRTDEPIRASGALSHQKLLDSGYCCLLGTTGNRLGGI